MKLLILMMAALVLSASAQETPLGAAGSVTVCMDPDSHRNEIRTAQQLASKIFETIGLKIDWRPVSDCERGEDVLRISLSSRIAGKQVPKAFAYALPYEGKQIVLFYDEVEKLAPHLRTIGLAYIMVHEVAHILEGIARHSERGIMKQLWTREDWFQIQLHRLGFATEDVNLIYLGLAARERKFRSAELIAGQ